MEMIVNLIIQLVAGAIGGNGAAAVLFRDGTVASLTNFGSITGGTGGSALNGGGAPAGQGGAGIQGATTGGISIINAGMIAGGMGGVDGGGGSGAQANAISLFGSDNRLELQSGYVFTGNVVVASGGSNNVLALGGAVDSSFNVSQIAAAQLFQGFTAFEKTGSSTWVLTGTGTYTGGTTLRGGVLSISSDANLGAASGALTFNGGTLQTTTANITTARNIVLGAGGGTFVTDRTLTIDGVISGAGALSKTGINNLVLGSANTYTGGTTALQGTIEAAVTGALGTGPVTIASGASLSITNDTKADALTIANQGAINFRNTSSAGTATITNNGGTSFNDASNAGSAVIVNNSAASLDFYGTASAGNATITNTSGGYVTFNGSSTADGATIVNRGGYLNISSVTSTGIAIGSLSGNGSVNLGSKTLTLGGLGKDDTIDGVIDGSFSGSLVKTGTGTLTLNGVNSYWGLTTIDGGRLVVGGSYSRAVVAGDVSVMSGGTLGGNGTVGNTIINAGGTLSPGNSIGALTVAGNLVMATASTYLVEVSPTNADFTHVTGTANLGGATLAAHYAPGSYVEKRYTILTADGGLGGSVFSGPVNSNLPSNFASSLAYDANNAWLDLVLSYTPPTAPGFGSGLTANQQNVANTLVNFFNSTGGIPLAFGALSPDGLTQASGEAATGSQQATFNAMNLFMGVLTDPFIAGRGDSAAPSAGALPFAEARAGSSHDAFAAMARKAAPGALPMPGFEQRWSVWSAAYGGSQTTAGNAATGSNTATSNLAGIAVGADYRLSPDTLAGFAMAGGGTSFRTANGLGSGRSDLFQAGGFIRHTIGNAYLTAALAYGWQDVSTDRVVTAAGLEQLNARFNSHAFSGRLEGGYRIATALVGLTPYAAGQFTRYALPGYAEQGSGLFALNYAARNVTASRSEFGIRTDKSFALQDAELTLRGRAAWAHNFDTDRAIGATFQALPGTAFVVNGAVQARDAALVTAAAEMKWTNGFALAASFEGEFSDTTESYAGKGVVRYSW